MKTEFAACLFISAFLYSLYSINVYVRVVFFMTLIRMEGCDLESAEAALLGSARGRQ